MNTKYSKFLTSAMDNTLASRLGKIARKAGSTRRGDVGDLIDRGLILRRLLKESGFYLVVKIPNQSTDFGHELRDYCICNDGIENPECPLHGIDPY